MVLHGFPAWYGNVVLGIVGIVLLYLAWKWWRIRSGMIRGMGQPLFRCVAVGAFVASGMFWFLSGSYYALFMLPIGKSAIGGKVGHREVSLDAWLSNPSWGSFTAGWDIGEMTRPAPVEGDETDVGGWGFQLSHRPRSSYWGCAFPAWCAVVPAALACAWVFWPSEKRNAAAFPVEAARGMGI